MSPREMECLLWAAKGKSAWATAKILGISDATVKFHLGNVRSKLNVTSSFRNLAAPPVAAGLSLTCYPLGHTRDGSPYAQSDDAGYRGAPPPAPPPPPMAMAAPMAEVVVTGSRMDMAKAAMVASEEALGDLKLYRVPEPITVAAKSMKQVVFLDRSGVTGEVQYRVACSPWSDDDGPRQLRMLLRTKNDKKHGLGVALPDGGATVFEPSSRGDLLLAEPSLRDYAEGQDVDLELGQSPSAFGLCVKDTGRDYDDEGYPWIPLHANVTNANDHPIAVRVELGASPDWTIRGAGKGLAVRDGQWSIEQVIPAGSSAKIEWQQRSAEARGN